MRLDTTPRESQLARQMPAVGVAPKRKRSQIRLRHRPVGILCLDDDRAKDGSLQRSAAVTYALAHLTGVTVVIPPQP